MSLFLKFKRTKQKPIANSLSESQIKAIFDTDSFLDVTTSATNVINIWPYVSVIPSSEHAGYQLTQNEEVETVRRNFENTFDLVHVVTDTKNAFLIIVVDLDNDKIYGHFVLDLNKEYGISKIN